MELYEKGGIKFTNKLGTFIEARRKSDGKYVLFRIIKKLDLSVEEICAIETDISKIRGLDSPVFIDYLDTFLHSNEFVVVLDSHEKSDSTATLVQKSKENRNFINEVI